jgi:hypothetical protein
MKSRATVVAGLMWRILAETRGEEGRSTRLLEIPYQ